MPVLLQVKDAHKRYASQVLLDGASFSLTDAQKAGFIGRNGSGKSTLCRIIVGDEEMEKGEVITHSDLRLGYLRQHDPFLPGETAQAFLERDSGEPEWRCAEVAARFEITGPILTAPVSDLSGGWQTRVKLAALLLHDPNLLLLDEPTNFLDLRTQLLLERFLRDWKGACLIVSHDRAFLRATCDRTLELSRGRIVQFSGGIDAYFEHRAKMRKHDEKVNATVETKRRQLQRFIDKNRASPKTSSQARSKAKQLARLTSRTLDEPEPTARIRVPRVEPRQGPALTCESLAVGYGDRTVARARWVEVQHGSRVVVVGDNGQGKTTFLRTVAGRLPALDGAITWGFGVTAGYYAQLVFADLPEHQTVFQVLESRAAPGAREQAIRNVAGGFLFSDRDIEKAVPVLSGGERARLCLAGLFLGGYNVLLLDEPGNHLDVETVEALARALKTYKGTVVFTSHDRYFADQVATDVLEVRDGRIAPFAGDHADYLASLDREIDEGFGLRPTGGGPEPDAHRREDKEAARRRFKLRRELASLERQMERLEEDRASLQDRFLACADPDEAQKLHEEMDRKAAKLSEVEDRWLGLQEEGED